MSETHLETAQQAREEGTSSSLAIRLIGEMLADPALRDRFRELLLELPFGMSSTGAAPGGPTVYMTSTEAQNGFGRLLDLVARDGTVLITKHNATQAVVMPVDRYKALTGLNSPDLNLLTQEFDELVRRMQTVEVQEAVNAAFWASPEELSRAAVAAAQREGR